MNNKYKHLFFDLDHTLYDFERSSHNTLVQLFEAYHLHKHWTFEVFHSCFKVHNEQLWNEYRQGTTSKELLKINRFLLTLRERQDCSITQAKELAEYYMEYAPLQDTLMPGALSVVEKLSKSYSLYIVTNGFVEAQYRKMENTGLKPYFKQVFISEKIGAAKPSKKFFQHAIRSANALKNQSLVVGDNLVADIQGALNFKLDTIWFNPQDEITHIKSTYTIKHLEELLDILQP